MDRKLNVLFIGAHPDDCDFKAGGLALKYTRAGHRVKFLSLCDGSGGHQTMTAPEIAARRKLETKEVGKFGGFEYEVWDITDCELINDLETRKRLTRTIREFCPDILFTCRINDYHVDHRNCAALVQDASYCLIVPHFCPEVPAMKEMPVIMNYYDRFNNPPFEPQVIVDIDDVIDEKFEMLSKHVSQVYEWLPYTRNMDHLVPEGEEARLNWLHEPRIPRDDKPLSKEMEEKILNNHIPYFSEWREASPAICWRDRLVAKYGEELGKRIRFAEAFCLCEYGTQLNEDKKQEYFPF